MLLVVNNRSHFISDLEQRLKELKVKYKLIDQTALVNEKSLHLYHGVILSGGPMLLDAKVYLGNLRADLECLLDCRGPILGICLGHQIIGEAYGGKIKRLKHLINKMNTVNIIERSDLFKGTPSKISVREAHHDDLLRIPSNFILLASSRATKVEAMKHVHKHIYGVQFHPEVSGTVGRKILKNFVEICERERKVSQKKRKKKINK